jgi:lysophospholipase L1-like esterase
MTVRKFSYLLTAALLLGAVQTAAAQEFFLKKGDVVVVMGDSITEQRLYSNYLELWSQTRFPAYNLVFRNVGIGGDTSGGGNGRFKRDVLPFKPTVLTVDFGMNDGGYIWPGKVVNKKEITAADVDARFATYMKGLQGIADQAKAANIRVAWITPQPREDNPGDINEKYNPTLEKFSAGVGEIAKKNAGLFADQFHPYSAVVQKARAAGEKGRITGGDGVHPGPPGQALMAASILKGLNFPKQVSSVELFIADAQNREVNCRVAQMVITRNGKKELTRVAFTREDAALPFFPYDNPKAKPGDQPSSILKWTPLLEDMNHYGLKVTGLATGNYEIKLGGRKVAEYSDKELAAGVNLAAAALAAGPVADQVKDVVKAVTDKTTYYHDQIYSPLVLQRNIAKNPDFKDVAKEDVARRRDALIAERLQKMPELDAAIRKALEPRTHLVEIVPAK